MRKELLAGCGVAREKKIALRGHEAWEGLVTLDMYAGDGIDIVHDLDVLPYPFTDETFDELHLYDCLEHQGRQGDWRFFFDQFTEFWRITKPGGTLHAICPSWSSQWAWGDPGHTRIIGVEQIAFLDQSLYGQGTMTDYRWYYKADWKLEWSNTEGHATGFLLRKSSLPLRV